MYFGNTQFTFVIILPNNRTGLMDLEAKLKDYNLKSIMKSFVNEKPYLTIPKFEIEYDIELNAILKNVRTCMEWSNFICVELHLTVSSFTAEYCRNIW